MTIPITSHDFKFRGYIKISENELTNIIFPFPLQAESGLPIQTEAGKDISIDDKAVAIPLVGGVVQAQSLHVTTED